MVRGLWPSAKCSKGCCVREAVCASCKWKRAFPVYARKEMMQNIIEIRLVSSCVTSFDNYSQHIWQQFFQIHHASGLQMSSLIEVGISLLA